MTLVLQRRGNYEKAGTLIRRAMTIQEGANPQHPAYATTLNLFAQQLWFEGDILASKEASERAVHVAEKGLRPDHPVVALALRYLAATLFDLGDSARCRELTERALAIAERNFGPRHHVTAEYFNDLGVVEKDEGDYPAARRHLQQTLEITKRITAARTSMWPRHCRRSRSWMLAWATTPERDKSNRGLPQSMRGPEA